MSAWFEGRRDGQEHPDPGDLEDDCEDTLWYLAEAVSEMLELETALAAL